MMRRHAQLLPMSFVWQEVSRMYGDRDTSSQFPHLDLRSFCDPAKPHAGFPLLKGKGAQIRHLAPILALVWNQHIRPGNRHDMHEAWLGHKSFSSPSVEIVMRCLFGHTSYYPLATQKTYWQQLCVAAYHNTINANTLPHKCMATPKSTAWRESMYKDIGCIPKPPCSNG